MSELYDLYRVTCEEYYDECPDLAYEERRISDAVEAAAVEAAAVEAECTDCGGYGYLGVRDELCGCGQSKDEDDDDFIAYLNGSHSLGALALSDEEHDDIPF